MDVKIILFIDILLFGAGAWSYMCRRPCTDDDVLWALCFVATAIINIFITLFI